MEKDLKEMLNGLKDVLETMQKMDFGKGKFKELMEKSVKEPCKITIEKNKKGECKMGVEGQRLALLITLAGAEQGILKQLSCNESEFEFIKNLVGTKEADNE